MSTTRASRGFSLIEVLVALALLTSVVSGAVRLIVLARRSVEAARRLTVGSALAEEKLEQLRSLTFSYDAAGAAVTDVDADLTTWPERSSGGSGLQPSPADALQRNVSGYCDFLGPGGGPLGGGATPPLDAAFVRRWLVRPLAVAPGRALVIQVRVLDSDAARRGGSGAGEVTVTTVRARWMP